MTGNKPRLIAFTRRLLPYLPALAVVGWFANRAISAVLAKTGHPAVPLDDAFIHFQFARNLANGHPFTYSPGSGYVAGATSLLWPTMLAPFFWLGVRELSIIWVAWMFGFLFLAALSLETYRLAARLTGQSTALGAGLAVAVFPAFLWFAASGMETIPFAWAMTRTARLVATWLESPPEDLTDRLFRQTAFMGIITPWFRPEGAMFSLVAVAALLARPRPGTRRWRRWYALIVLAGPLLSPLLNLLKTGQAASNTTVSKWLIYDPYLSTVGAMWSPIAVHLQLLFGPILNGQKWSAVFLPGGSKPLALLSLAGLFYAGWHKRRGWTAAMVLFLALSVVVTTTYHSFLWNELRYLWPFASGWLVGAACVAGALGDIAGAWKPQWKLIAPLLAGAMAGALLGNHSRTYTDLAKSALAIDRQQVALGSWARDRLPKGALIGVNDTGAIAYVSGHPTFDIIGLTTQGETRYWVAGAGSRFEHYEHLFQRDPRLFPSFFIVYPGWMDCHPVLGERLQSATVFDQSNLGAATMTAYRARTDLLGSGARPLQPPLPGAIVDELDVSDLESERSHQYVPPIGYGAGNDNRVLWGVAKNEGNSERETPWADGGRMRCIQDQFLLRTGGAKDKLQIIARLYGPAEADVSVRIMVDGTEVVRGKVPAGRMRELSGGVPNGRGGSHDVRVQTVGPGTFGSLHYWLMDGAAAD